MNTQPSNPINGRQANKRRNGLMWRPGFLRENAQLFHALQRLLDPILLCLAGVIAYRLYLGSWEIRPDYLFPLLIMATLVAIVFPACNVYQSWRGSPLLEELQSVGIALAVVTGLLVVTAMATKTTGLYSRGWFGIWIGLGWCGLLFSRFFLRNALSWLRQHGLNRRTVIIVGDNEHAKEVAQQIIDSPWTGLDVLGYFGEEPNLKTSPMLPFAGNKETPALKHVSHLGSFDEIVQLTKKEVVDQIWIALPLHDEARMEELLEDLKHCTADIRYVPDLYGYNLLNHSISHVAGLPVINLSVTPMSGVNHLLKEIEDKAIAFSLLLVISPILVLIALGVKLSTAGPVFYHQERVGWNGRRFMMLKFRSMPVDTEQEEVTWGNAQDKTPTAFGAFIRRYSLDELPQFFNVLKGDMSIVGPRPERPMFVEEFKETIPNYMKKHVVKAGITGWAQINGLRGDTNLAQRIEHDLYYIENWSVWLDMKIILLTPFRGMLNSNAK